MSALTAEHRLATYGTLAPGKPNHPVVAEIGGHWLKGTVIGRLYAEGWGADQGCPGMVPDPAGEAIAVDVLEAVELTAHWMRLDAFEGHEYERIILSVTLSGGAVMDCSIYALRRSP
ncbi:MAG: gamma-glutamylcyclotransferase family protein [Pseudomonadota bacterium]